MAKRWVDVDGHSPACLANSAAGLEVEKFGIAAISRDQIRADLGLRPPDRKIVSLEKLLSLLDECRRDHRKIVFTNGCFDLLHVGHVRCLEEAASLGDVLIVAINSDESVRAMKGANRPLIGAEQRAEMLAAMACVDFVVVFDDATPNELLHAIKPDVVVKGGTYNADGIVGREIVEAYGGAIHATSLTTGISTTQLAERLGASVADAVSTREEDKTEPVGEQRAAPATNGHIHPCIHLGHRVGFRDCRTCEGNVRQKVFACNHPSHTETTLPECKACPDFSARPDANEARVGRATTAVDAEAAGDTAGQRQVTTAELQRNLATVGEHATGLATTNGGRVPRYADRLRTDAGLAAVGPQPFVRAGQAARPAPRAVADSRQLILQSFQSPGDVVMLTAAVRDLHLAHPGRFQTDVRTSVPALWENNPYITPLDAAVAGVRVVEMHYDLINECNTRPYHFVHGYIQHLERQLDVTIPVTGFHGDIHLSSEEKQWMSQVDELGFHGDFWIVMAGGKHDFTAKWWNPGSYQKVVDHFRGRIQFVQCGEEGHFHPPLDGAINLVGKTDARQFIRLMHHAAGVLCPVTYAMHLAAAVETKPGRPPHRACVVVGGGREPPHWEAYPHHQYISTVGSLPCCEHGGCWRSRCQPVGDGDTKDGALCERPVQVSPDLRIPQCMEMITAEDVVRRIELYYEGEILAYLDENRRPD